MGGQELLQAEIDAMIEPGSERRKQTIADLDEYYSTYTGRFFEHYSALGDENAFDANDIAAAATLSVPLTGKAVEALTERADEFNELLRMLPGRDATIWDAHPSQIGEAERLYELLKTIPDVSYVTTSKLLASKRPHLIPIRDSLVERLLGTPKVWWSIFEGVLDDRGMRDGLASLQTEAETVPPTASLLRVLDVALWRHAKRLNG